MQQPVPESLDIHCKPLDLLPALARLPGPLALLSSADRGEWDILMAEPVRTLCLAGGQLQARFADGRCQALPGESPFRLLESWQAESACVQLPHAPEWPFLGGLAGYWAYETGLPLHGLGPCAKPGPDVPGLWVGDYRWALLHHRPTRRWWLVSEGASQRQRILSWLASAAAGSPAPAFALESHFSADWDRQGYNRAFAGIRDYLQAGDCYQVNLARHFSASYEGDPLGAFMTLQSVHEAPFSAYVGLPGRQAILSFSPESFLTVSPGGHVSTRPIKGTRPRHRDPAQDRQALAELLGSEKDRAENLMIVDLLRNDLGRCCVPGSIRVPALFAPESHPNVHHLASTVEGQCRPGTSPLAVLEACFPGGSITGAPKKRAMEIIAELEPVRRSAYCGAIGYISRDGRMDTSIAIRTLVADGQRLHCWGGSGIVADSQAGEEFQECADKVNAFMDQLPVKA